MKVKKIIFRWLSSLRITAKFGLAFGFLLIILLTQTVIAFNALSIIWQSNNEILANTEIQRLALGISLNWESIISLRQNFFYQSSALGVEKAYDLYALKAGEKISEVIRDGAKLKRLASFNLASEKLNSQEPDLDLLLSISSEYASILQDVSDLQIEMQSENHGLQNQLDQKAEEVFAIFQSADQLSEIASAYIELRISEKSYLLQLANPATDKFSRAISRLRNDIETSNLSDGNKISALAALGEYEAILIEIQTIALMIHEKLDLLNELDKSVNPILLGLRVYVYTEEGLQRLLISETRQRTTLTLIASMILGLVAAILIAVFLNFNVTRKIISLTKIANQFHDGNLDARAQIGSRDELGIFARTFNEMAEVVKKLNADLREQAIRDSLTGLFNRRYYTETLHREMARTARSADPLTLILVDVDNFKEINDVFGHTIGDQFLLQLAQLLKTESRVEDVVCRYGGDEFIILMAGIGLEDGRKRVMVWKKDFEKSSIVSNGKNVHSTFSAGIVEWNHKDSQEELFNKVDASLYRAKKFGRNQIDS